MCSRSKPKCRAFAVAVLLLGVVPYVALAERDPADEDEADHSNQDWGQPDASKLPRPGDPARWGGVEGAPGQDGFFSVLGLRPFGHGYSVVSDDVMSAGLNGRLDVSAALADIVAEERFVGPPAVSHDLVKDGGAALSQIYGPPPLETIDRNGLGPPARIPEPATLVLLMFGGVLAAARRR